MTPPAELEGGYSRRVLRWVIGIAVASFLAAVVLTAFGPELAPKPSAGADSFSYSAIGHRGLVELLRGAGLTVTTRTIPGGPGGGPRWPVVLAEPDPNRVAGDLGGHLDRLITDAQKDGGVAVVVLPKWQAKESSTRPGWAAEVTPRPTDSIVEELRRLAPSWFPSLELRRGAGTGLESCRWADTGAEVPIHRPLAQSLAPIAGYEPVLTCPGGLLIGRRGPVWVIADPDLVNNHGLAHEENAVAVHRLFQDLLQARGATFDETLHGFTRTDSLLAEAFRFPLWPATFQAALLLGLVLWAGMGRFGSPLPAARGLAAGKMVLIENTADLLRSGGHLVDSLERYHRQTVAAVAAGLALPPGLPEPELFAALERIGQRRGCRHDPGRLAQRINRLQNQADAARRALEIARDLHAWRQEMSGPQSIGKSK